MGPSTHDYGRGLGWSPDSISGTTRSNVHIGTYDQVSDLAHSLTRIKVHFEMPTLEYRVRVTHSSLYCAEHDPVQFSGTAFVAPVTTDWLGTSPR